MRENQIRKPHFAAPNSLWHDGTPGRFRQLTFFERLDCQTAIAWFGGNFTNFMQLRRFSADFEDPVVGNSSTSIFNISKVYSMYGAISIHQKDCLTHNLSQILSHELHDRSRSRKENKRHNTQIVLHQAGSLLNLEKLWKIPVFEKILYCCLQILCESIPYTVTKIALFQTCTSSHPSTWN